MVRIPPKLPMNPYTLPESAHPGINGQVGITDEHWDTSLDEWLDDHPAFERKMYTAEGQPADGSFQSIWDEVLAVQAFHMRISAIPSPADQPRRTLRTVVQRCGDIQNAVCLGLGRINWVSKVQYKKVWVQQCGMFLAVCQLIEEKQRMQPGSLPKVFQDPLFQLEDEYILQKIGNQRIIETPAANDLMNHESFVYAPHFQAHVMFETFLMPDQKLGLLYTNSTRGTLDSLSWPIVESCINEVYSNGNTTVTAAARRMFEMGQRFIKSYEEVVYKAGYSEERAVVWAFTRSSFYLPKPQPAAHLGGLTSHLLERGK